jgi:hypothetical protein
MGNRPSSSQHLRLRLPTLEIFAVQSGAAFSVAGRGLTDRERKIAKDVFQDSIDLSTVRIVISSVAAAPTTLGNNIRTNGPMSDAVLVHELTHVWQYQNLGTRYISDSAYHQTVAMVSGDSRNGAYNVQVVANKSFTDYTAEHQAMIVESWYRYPALQTDPLYQALLDEVRRARPLDQNVWRSLILEEAAYGPAMGHQRLLPPSTSGRAFDLGGAPSLPLLRLEF